MDSTQTKPKVRYPFVMQVLPLLFVWITLYTGLLCHLFSSPRHKYTGHRFKGKWDSCMLKDLWPDLTCIFSSCIWQRGILRNNSQCQSPLWSSRLQRCLHYAFVQTDHWQKSSGDFTPCRPMERLRQHKKWRWQLYGHLWHASYTTFGDNWVQHSNLSISHCLGN